ncbi:DUF1707 SHOCT-like domain-containing protein [Nocardia mexicana]|uniref:Uncharacterized protein DUF1707 n=1 Tax=Nocardia mexicana TaxID=279262 RepID=A0A370GSK6_9NOCA|nr:DUF1707 domain-containing protein [Nocardia mexicana]RDI46675.1 uncharacterized protein DUF1707 [Nocardia mexicana]
MNPARHRGLRVRDADRVDACALLDTARDDGQITAGEHGERTAAALRAKTFGDLDALIGDLQIPGGLVRSAVVNPSRRRGPRRWIPAVVAVALAASIGALVGVAATDHPRPGDPDLPDLTTARGIETFLADYRTHFGDLLVDELTLHPEHASFERAAVSRTLNFTYRGEFDDSSSSDRDREARPFDLGAIDLPLLARYLAGATQTVGAPDGAVTHIMIERSTDMLDDDPVVTIYVKGGAGGGYLVLTPAGEPVRVVPVSR